MSTAIRLWERRVRTLPADRHPSLGRGRRGRVAADARPDDLPWIVDEIVAGRVVNVPAVADLPPAAGADAVALRAAGVRSFLVAPAAQRGQGWSERCRWSACATKCPWTDEIVPRLGLFGNMLLGALAQRSAEQRARRAMAEAAQSRERLAHLARVDAVGAMTAAIAHEINQPLMAIANYAHAAAAAACERRCRRSRQAGRAAGESRTARRRWRATCSTACARWSSAADARSPGSTCRILLESALQLIDIEGRLEGRPHRDRHRAATLRPVWATRSRSSRSS